MPPRRDTPVGEQAPLDRSCEPERSFRPFASHPTSVTRRPPGVPCAGSGSNVVRANPVRRNTRLGQQAPQADVVLQHGDQTLSLSRIAVADDPAGYPVDDRCPASRHFSVNHTDFPASNSTTPQSCASNRTISRPRPCGSFGPGFWGTGQPAPPSVTVALTRSSDLRSSSSIGPEPCTTALLTSSLTINSAAVTTSSSQFTNSNRMTPLAKAGASAVAGRRLTILTGSQPFSVDREGHFPWWI